jgi:hypothetical protein
MELKLSMDIKALRGPLYVWLPPPPGDRMWFSFLEAPQLQVTASPLVGLILSGGRNENTSYIKVFFPLRMVKSAKTTVVAVGIVGYGPATLLAKILLQQLPDSSHEDK